MPRSVHKPKYCKGLLHKACHGRNGQTGPPWRTNDESCVLGNTAAGPELNIFCTCLATASGIAYDLQSVAVEALLRVLVHCPRSSMAVCDGHCFADTACIWATNSIYNTWKRILTAFVSYLPLPSFAPRLDGREYAQAFPTLSEPLPKQAH